MRVEDRRPSTDRHCAPLDVVAMANQRHNLRSEGALQEKTPRFKARRRNSKDAGASACAADVTDNTNAIVKTIPIENRLPGGKRGRFAFVKKNTGVLDSMMAF